MVFYAKKITKKFEYHFLKFFHPPYNVWFICVYLSSDCYCIGQLLIKFFLLTFVNCECLNITNMSQLVSICRNL